MEIPRHTVKLLLLSSALLRSPRACSRARLRLTIAHRSLNTFSKHLGNMQHIVNGIMRSRCTSVGSTLVEPLTHVYASREWVARIE